MAHKIHFIDIIISISFYIRLSGFELDKNRNCTSIYIMHVLINFLPVPNHLGHTKLILCITDAAGSLNSILQIKM